MLTIGFSLGQALVIELDDSQKQLQDLRVKLAEKDNFLEAMRRRETVLRIDESQRQEELASVVSHIHAIEARIERIKMERRAMELVAQKYQYNWATDALAGQASDIAQVSSAIGARLQRMDSNVKESVQQEMSAMRRSLQPDVASGMAADQSADQAVAQAVAGPVPGTISLLQAKSRDAALRGRKSRSA